MDDEELVGSSNEAVIEDTSTQLQETDGPVEEVIDKPEVPQEPAWIKDRLARFTDQKYKMQGEIDDLRAELKASKTVKKEIVKDEVDQDTWVQHLAEKKARELFDENQAKAQAESKIQAEQSQKIQTWQNKIGEFSKKAPDYAEVVQNSSIELPHDVLLDIMDSDLGPDLVYHLAKNPVEAEKLATLNDRSRDRYLARLEIKVEGSLPTPITPKSVSTAPPPVSKPSGSNAPNANQPKTLSDFIKQRNEEDRRAGKL